MERIESYLLDNLHEFVGFARKRLGNPELAADAVQESLLKALKAAEQIRDEENAKAWFYRILRRTILDLYRRRDARDRALEEFAHELNATPDAEEERIVCASEISTMRPRYMTAMRSEMCRTAARSCAMNT